MYQKFGQERECIAPPRIPTLSPAPFRRRQAAFEHERTFITGLEPSELSSVRSDAKGFSTLLRRGAAIGSSSLCAQQQRHSLHASNTPAGWLGGMAAAREREEQLKKALASAQRRANVASARLEPAMRRGEMESKRAEEAAGLQACGVCSDHPPHRH